MSEAQALKERMVEYLETRLGKYFMRRFDALTLVAEDNRLKVDIKMQPAPKETEIEWVLLLNSVEKYRKECSGEPIVLRELFCICESIIYGELANMKVLDLEKRIDNVLILKLFSSAVGEGKTISFFKEQGKKAQEKGREIDIDIEFINDDIDVVGLSFRVDKKLCYGAIIESNKENISDFLNRCEEIVGSL